jgi:hypothetical protein
MAERLATDSRIIDQSNRGSIDAPDGRVSGMAVATVVAPFGSGIDDALPAHAEYTFDECGSIVPFYRQICLEELPCTAREFLLREANRTA